jgi:rhodanese-related sulfurtransferase
MSRNVRRLLIVVASLLTAAAVEAQSGAASSLLVSPAELQRALGDPNTEVLHGGPREGYDAGHIPGARFVELRDVSAPRREGTLALELPDDEALRAALESFGIGDRSRVVVAFGDEWVSPATRVVFTLQAAGLGNRTRLLEGGTAAWKRAGLPLVKDAPASVTRGRLTSSSGRSEIRIPWCSTSGRARAPKRATSREHVSSSCGTCRLRAARARSPSSCLTTRRCARRWSRSALAT